MQGQWSNLLHECHQMTRLFGFLMLAVFLGGGSCMADGEIRVGLYSDPKCTDEKSREAAWRVLQGTTGLRLERVTTNSVILQPDFPQRFDVLVLPGGTGNGQARSLGFDGAKKLTEFVSNGGGVIAICAGGYLVVEGWNPLTKAVELVNAKSWDDDHWARGEQFIAVELVGTDSSDTSRTMWFENGPIFVPGTLDLPKYTPLVRYVTDLAAKDAPKGMMTGRDAVVASVFGKGRVVAFGPHPELSPDLNHWLVNSVRWVARRDGSSSASVAAVLEGR